LYGLRLPVERSMTASHPHFARAYHRRSHFLEERGVAEHRRELLAGLYGRVVEIGAGNGLNFRHYPDAVSEIVAVEPEPFLLDRARDALHVGHARVTLLRATAERLPLHDGSFDAVVCSLVLCSVTSTADSLAEMRRVLRREGQVRFYEHVAAESPGHLRLQRWSNPVWKRIAGGCNLVCDTEVEFKTAGLQVDRCIRFDFRPSRIGVLTSPHIIGTARM
jgi:ubiquinone/menaquinone biosynthesis C-methylase UbiE